VAIDNSGVDISGEAEIVGVYDQLFHLENG
jgi:hypothetical protein